MRENTGETQAALQSLVLELARLIDPAPGCAEHWFGADPIDALGGRTAAQMIADGHGIAVLSFLVRVAHLQAAVPIVAGLHSARVPSTNAASRK